MQTEGVELKVAKKMGEGDGDDEWWVKRKEEGQV